MKPRFFICFYNGVKSHKNVVNDVCGSFAMFNEQGKYINRDYAESSIKKIMNLSQVVLTNIIELNEEDYKEYLA